jgi:3-oxoacyl-(acyl-carrier-protein) synthase
MGKAKRMFESGDCAVVVAGGHCSMLNELTVAGFHLLGTLSTRNDEPLRASRPFDRTRDGFVMGEGAGILILEELSHAEKRGARIYAELSGYGSSSNAYRITDSPPDGSRLLLMHGKTQPILTILMLMERQRFLMIKAKSVPSKKFLGSGHIKFS